MAIIEYKLNNPDGDEPKNTRTAAPSFVERAMNWAKATNEITGVVRGLLADGVVNEQEAIYLRNWIRKRPELLNDSLVRSIAARIDRVFQDGKITKEELLEITQILHDFAPDDNLPASLPLDIPSPTILIKDKSFCFTGKFVSGSRTWCEDQISCRGGIISDRVYFRLDYLVIGSKASGAWRNQTYGKKIESALGLKEAGGRTKIVREDHWLTFLE